MIKYMHPYFKTLPFWMLMAGDRKTSHTPLLSESRLEDPDDLDYPAVPLDEDSQAELLLLYSIGNP